MQRILRPSSLVLLGLLVSGLALATAQSPTEAEPTGELEPGIAALQEQHIALLRERVTSIETVVGVGMIDRTTLLHAQIELLTVEAEYAESTSRKQVLLQEIMAIYDTLIEFAEAFADAPPPVSAGQPAMFTGTFEALRLKAERVRVQISHDKLN